MPCPGRRHALTPRALALERISTICCALLSRWPWSAPLVADDVVIWDNAASVHCRDGWPDEQTRAVWHLLPEGEQPTPMFARRTVNANNTAQLGY